MIRTAHGARYTAGAGTIGGEMRRRGKFRVSARLLDEPNIGQLFAWLEFVPLHVEHEELFTTYIGLSRQFDEVPDDVTPMYELMANWNEYGGLWFDAIRMHYSGEKA